MVKRRPTSYRSKRPDPRRWKGNKLSSQGDTRIIKIGRSDYASRFPNNKIISSKYTLWTFLPKNLYEQFRRVANFYFLCMTIVAYTIVSPVSPLTSLLPLIFVVVVTGVKQAYEDFLRHKADRDVNNTMITIVRDGIQQEVPAKKIQVGDLVKIYENQDIPCDIVLLVSSHKESKCFVTTSNLDGETNLKTLYCPKSLKRNLTEVELGSLNATIECENPTPDLYKFNGRLEYGKRTSHALRQSMVRREQTFRSRRPSQSNNCCLPDCTKCDLRVHQANVCTCQCRKDHEELEIEGVLKEEDEEDALAGKLAKTHRTIGQRQISQQSPKMVKKHRKTDSNVSRVSFNVADPSLVERRDSGGTTWTLNRKASVLLRRQSTLLISRRPSEATGEAIIDALNTENLLLRGAKLKTTAFVYGCAVYTGLHTKLALNSKITSNKFSTVEKSVNKFLIFYLVLLVVEAVLSTALKTVNQTNIGFDKESRKFEASVLSTPKSYDKASTSGGSTGVDFQTLVVDFFTYVVLYNYVIPISLYVTMELQKFLGTLFFEWDLRMYDSNTNEGALANTSDLNEDLGQIQYLFTDKTGTLTENNMRLRMCSVEGKTYKEKSGALYPMDSKRKTIGEKVDLTKCNNFMQQFLLALTLCHTVQVHNENEKEIDRNGDNDDSEDSEIDETIPNPEVERKLRYSSSSPDEKALVEAMERLDLVFVNSDDDLIVVEIFGQGKIYRRLEVLEFTSDRKRMSVIVEDEDHNMYLYCKGAETAVMPLAAKDDQLLEITLTDIGHFAMDGLRTLMVGYRKIDKTEYDHIAKAIQHARQSLSGNRDTIVAEAYEKIEKGLTILGATGVEDELQDGVKETLTKLKDAGIKVWILTGDKVETAVNISHSCGHFKSGTVQMSFVDKTTAEDCAEILKQYKHKMESERFDNYGLVVDGRSLALALLHEKDLFREVCMLCSAVVCCRMSPLQKSQVVNMVKKSKGRPVTAAIGDGANDVAMIQEAHIGLGDGGLQDSIKDVGYTEQQIDYEQEPNIIDSIAGVMGKEGRQAVKCSDFAFSRFRYLQDALLVHGHWYYLRIATLVQYFFYKNLVFILPQLYFLFYNGYSTQPLYDSMYLTCFNVLFTSLPIFYYGLSEQNYSAQKLRSQPSLYMIHRQNNLMTWKNFFAWMALGIWHSLVVFFLPIISYMYNSAVMPNGRDISYELFGTQVYHGAVIVVSIKLLLHSRYWCRLILGSLILSIVLLILVSTVYSLVFIPSITYSTYYSYVELLSSLYFWLLTFVAIVVCLIPDIALDVFKSQKELWEQNKISRTIAPLFSKRTFTFNTRL